MQVASCLSVSFMFKMSSTKLLVMAAILATLIFQSSQSATLFLNPSIFSEQPGFKARPVKTLRPWQTHQKLPVKLFQGKKLVKMFRN